MNALATFRKRWVVWWFQWRFIKRMNSGRQHKALRLVWQNELPKARALLARRREPRSQFRRACAELEAGDLAAAERSTSTLPDDPVRGVLSALIAARSPQSPFRARVDPTWLGALNTAWRDAGGPDLRTSELVDDDFQQSYDRGGNLRALDPDERMIWRWMTSEYGFFRRRSPAQVQRWAAANVARFGIAELVIAASVLNVEPIHDVYRDVIARIHERAPDNLSIRLARFTTTQRGWLGHSRLAALEAVVDAPNVDAFVTGDVYTRLERIAAKSGSRSPELPAYKASLSTVLLPALEVLVEELPESRGPSRRAAGELIVRLGRRLLEDRYLITSLFGTVLLRKGAAALGDQKIFNEIASRQVEIKQFGNIHQHLRLDAMRWPLPSLFRETLQRVRTNEIAYYREALRDVGA